MSTPDAPDPGPSSPFEVSDDVALETIGALSILRVIAGLSPELAAEATAACAAPHDAAQRPSTTRYLRGMGEYIVDQAITPLPETALLHHTLANVTLRQAQRLGAAVAAVTAQRVFADKARNAAPTEVHDIARQVLDGTMPAHAGNRADLRGQAARILSNPTAVASKEAQQAIRELTQVAADLSLSDAARVGLQSIRLYDRVDGQADAWRGDPLIANDGVTLVDLMNYLAPSTDPFIRTTVAGVPLLPGMELMSPADNYHDGAHQALAFIQHGLRLTRAAG